MNGFQQQKSKGKQAEQIVKKHLQSRGIEVVDVAEVPDYQKIDIDFLIKKNGKIKRAISFLKQERSVAIM